MLGVAWKHTAETSAAAAVETVTEYIQVTHRVDDFLAAQPYYALAVCGNKCNTFFC